MVGKEPTPARASAADPAAAFEATVLSRFTAHAGRDFARLARVVGREGKGGKAAVATIVRNLAGERKQGRSGDFLRFGIEVKTVPVDASGKVVEAMSFPAFVHQELITRSGNCRTFLAD